MCASYGLQGSIPELVDEYALDERRVDERLRKWLTELRGKARITGARAKNLNPIIRQDDKGRRLDMAWWWLWLDGGGPAKFDAFNSRDDRLMSRWRKYFRTWRAVVPATSFVEKKRDFHLDGDIFTIAAIYHEVETDDGPLLTYSLVTQDTPAEHAHVNGRMPLVLAPDAIQDWLDPDIAGDQELIDRALQISSELAHSLKVADDSNPLF